MQIRFKFLLAAAIFLAVMFAILNIRSSLSERDRVNYFAGLVFNGFQMAYLWIDSSLYSNNKGDTFNTSLQLEEAFSQIMWLDAVVRSFNREFGDIYRYPSFRFIASVSLGASINYFDFPEQGGGSPIKIKGIKKDGLFSDSEIVFLTRLRDDLKYVRDALSNHTGWQVREFVSLGEIRQLLDNFLNYWRWQTDSTPDRNPFLLLQYE